MTAELGRLQFFVGNFERASELLELAVDLGESFLLPEVLADVLNSYGLINAWNGRVETGFALMAHSLKVALENDLATPALRAYNNLGDNAGCRDRYDEALDYHDGGIALARRVGNRQWERQLLIESVFPLTLTGKWDESIERAEAVPGPLVGALAVPAVYLTPVYIARGQIDEARKFLSLLPESSTDVQVRAVFSSIAASVHRAEGLGAEALQEAEEAIDARRFIAASHQAVKLGFSEGVESAFELGSLDRVERLLATFDALRPGEVPPFLHAQVARFRARLAASREEHDQVESGFKRAAALFREFGVPFWLALTQLEHGDWLALQGRIDEGGPLLTEAREIFGRLGAAPWLERLDRAPLAEPARVREPGVR
jgi:tetratricopeptide (TPR) repeat protein